MVRSPADPLRDALDAIDAIDKYTKGGKTAFDRNSMVRDAVCARLIQIGQAVKDAQIEGLKLATLRPEIPWRNIAGMRDRLGPKYEVLDKAVGWGVVEGDLPAPCLAVVAPVS